jgi:hypothetical protein
MISRYSGSIATVSGYTDTNVELMILRTSLPKIMSKRIIRLYSEEHMMAHMRDLMANILSNPKIEGVPPSYEHLRIKRVPRHSAGVETFFTPHTLHPLH